MRNDALSKELHMKKCKYHCDYGDGENCHYKSEGDCIYIKGRRLSDTESMGMLFDDFQDIPNGVIPIIHEYRDTNLTVKQCGNCLAQLFLENQKYCAECGSKIRWDDVT